MTGSARIVTAGLTGGLASGKSTVAAILRTLGALHLDADAIVHELLAPKGAAFAPVVARFDPAIVRPDDGTIDRKALAARVFADPAELSALNAIVHPLVRAEIARRIAAAASAPAPPPAAIVDAPVLVEAGMHRDLDALIVVACRPETQIARAVARGGLTEAEARARVAAQAPLAAKLALADYVIDTDGTLAETDRRTREVWERLLADRRA